MRLSNKVDKTGIWKFVSVVIAVIGILWGASYTIYGAGVEKREEAIKANTVKIATLAEKQAAVLVVLEHLKQGQQDIDRKLEKTTSDILNAIKKIDK